MKKTLLGIVISTKQQNTAVVKVTRKTTHPLYKKLLTVSKKYQVDTQGKSVQAGDTVTISEVKPISKVKHFVILEVIKHDTA